MEINSNNFSSKSSSIEMETPSEFIRDNYGDIIEIESGELKDFKYRDKLINLIIDLDVNQEKFFKQGYTIPHVSNKIIEWFDSKNQNGILITTSDLGCYALYELRKDKNEAAIHELYVDPNFRGKGYATHLINYIKSIAFKENISKVVLGVHKNNIDAITLYKKNGFTIAKQIGRTDFSNGELKLAVKLFRRSEFYV